MENRPVSITKNGTVTTFEYDGDGNRISKTGNGETILYINGYYEKNVTTGNVTTSYYLGGRLIAQKEGTEIRYIHQDHLGGTSMMTSDNGSSLGTIRYYPYGSTMSGDVPTDMQFTGQRYDDTGLYYYNARYYDPEIGRFISADSIVPYPSNPQSFNRYSYCLNNPLIYTDPSGHWSIGKFLKGVGDALLETLKAAFPPYQLWEHTIKPIYQLCTNQITWDELMNPPSLGERWEAIKEYYDITDERGQGRIFGDVAQLIALWKVMPKGGNLAKIESAETRVFLQTPKGTRVSLNILKNWYKSTFDDALESIDYHFREHGMGRTIEQYTNDALNFYNTYKSQGQNVILRDGSKGIRIKLNDGRGGYFTPDGRVVSFWYE